MFPGIQRKMIGAAVCRRLLNDLGIDSQPARVPQFLSWCSDEGIDRELTEHAPAHVVGRLVSDGRNS